MRRRRRFWLPLGMIGVGWALPFWEPNLFGLTLLLSICAVFICDGAAARSEREAERLRRLLCGDDMSGPARPLISDGSRDRRPD